MIPRFETHIGDWWCQASASTDGRGARSVSHPDGTGFSCDRRNGLAATCHQERALPPEVLAWLIYPLLAGHVRSDDLEDLLEKVGQP